MKNIFKNLSYKVFMSVILVFVMVLAGCADKTYNNKTESPKDNTVEKKEEVKEQEMSKISLEFWSAPVMEETYYQKAIQNYTSSIAPHVDINLSYVPFNGIDEKVNVALAANNFPDLYMDGSARVGPLSARGVAAPLDSYITDDYNIDDFYQGPLQLTKVDGKTTMCIVAANASVMMLNKALFEKAGAEDLLPDPDTRAWSRDTFKKAVEKIGALGDGIYGMGLAVPSYTHNRYLDGYIYNEGAPYTDEAFNQVIYNTEQNAKNFEWIIDVATSKYAVPGATGNEDRALLELFKQGKLAAMNYNAGYYGTIQAGIKDGSIKAPINIMFAHYPTTDGSIGKLWLSIYGIIAKKQDDPKRLEESAKFAMYLSSGKDKDANEGFYIVKGQIPVRKSLQSTLAEPELRKLATMAENPVGNIFSIPNFFQMRKAWADQHQQAIIGKISPKEALDNFAKDAQKLLDEAKQIETR